MESYKFLGSVQILKESIKILPKNGKVLAFIVILSFLLYTLIYLLNIFSLTPLILDMVIKQSSSSIPNPDGSFDPPNPFGILKNMGIVLGVESVFILLYFITSFFTTIATIFTSATSYCNKNISLKDLILRIAKSWIRPIVTVFYMQLLSIGYVYISAVAILIPFSIISDHPVASKAIIIVLGIFAATLYLYLMVVWLLGLVISVIEDNCYGVEALGKGGHLVKGNRLDGFILNLIFNLSSVIIFSLYWIGKDSVKGPGTQMVVALILVFGSSLISMVQLTAYTVLYFQCKKSHGEEISELGGSIKYSALPTTLHNQDIL